MNINDVEKVYQEGKNRIEDVEDENELNNLRAELVGKKSSLNSLFSKIKELTIEEKKVFGEKINKARDALNSLIAEKQEKIRQKKLAKKIESEKIDVTLPSRTVTSGAKNPFKLIVDDFVDYFMSLGYEVVEGSDVETDHYNFELLNIPKDHPSRDMQDTFFIDKNRLLRSHTSAAQAHVMERAKGKGPIKVICPGKTYRRDEDVTHSHQFGQIECLVIDENATMGQLEETLTLMLRHFFGENRKVRFRPSFFPFTEPSVEVDMSCFSCEGKGCSMCKHTGWIELLGAGMVNPNVLRLNGFDDEKYKGFAFGIGIDRFAMLKYGIDDIKRIYTNDIDFLKQFSKE
ncbi:MAG TPA: phenylalanine--tRNA ligase subunit alpha [Firmicutes bacterium]|nr:phenylalanine--tRNA ligase subunit alpha [Bacillota bacterium]